MCLKDLFATVAEAKRMGQELARTIRPGVGQVVVEEACCQVHGLETSTCGPVPGPSSISYCNKRISNTEERWRKPGLLFELAIARAVSEAATDKRPRMLVSTCRFSEADLSSLDRIFQGQALYQSKVRY